MMFRYAAVLALGVMPLVHAGSLDVQLENYRQQAKAAQPGFSGFSASRGRAFYLKKIRKTARPSAAPVATPPTRSAKV
ncbi:hypothetical protein [Paludibacterium denitrificans]|uniref:hypothetical protein n=1 Tax=Paludibacterium denitrificans TaxID=2675226 RepID=UPI001E2AD4EF|nr:hypothetical protein [Paludibacterium denitrificans]